MNYKELKKIHRYFFIILCLAVFSCSTYEKDPYNRVGSAPNMRQYLPQKQYPTRYPPYYAPPASRVYRNPYSAPPRAYYPPYYDLDEYYVPPSGYYDTTEPDHGVDPNVKY